MPLPGNPFGKNPATRQAPDAPAAKSRLTVGSLFNPNIGATLRPFGETGKMLTNLIASIFAANGLFPPNHPALLGISGARLTLSEVISTGWHNVRFTQKTLPQALIFFAVVISLICSVVAVFAVGMSLLTGTAHAQTLPTGASMFQAPAPSTDIALGWMNWLFFGQPMATDYLGPQGQVMPAGASDSMGLSTIIQTALVQVFAFYSDAILVVAAIILFYHLTAMIVETAHHGVAMGRRANQVWAPIRLVVAIGLLVPISSGLNSGQYILLQVAAWGSGLASNAWSYFLTELQTDTSGYVPPKAPYDRSTVSDTYTTAACQMAWNTIINWGVGPTSAKILDSGYEIDNPDGSKKFSYSPSGTNDIPDIDEDICGFYVQPAPPGSAGFTTAGTESTIASNIQGAVQGAFQAMQTQAIDNGENDVTCFIPSKYFKGNNGAPAGALCPDGDIDQKPANTDLEPMVSKYEDKLQSTLQGVAVTMNGTMTNAAALSTQSGWASAGAWFNTIARLQGDITSLPHDMLPKTAPPQVFRLVRENRLTPGTIEFDVAQIMVQFNQWANRGYNTAISGVTVPQMTGANNQQTQLMTAQAGIMQNGGEDKPHFMDYIFEGIDLLASMDGVWNANPDNCNTASCFTLGVQFTSYNPLAEIAAFGHSNLNAAYDIFDEYILLAAGGSAVKDLANAVGVTGGFRFIGIFAKAFQAAAAVGTGAIDAIGSVIGTIVVVFFTSGFLLAFFLPLIPFYRFLFGILSWFLSLLEGVVAIPLIALAHLTPEGEGFMGDKAKTAYYYVFDIFLRPILMVFGLIAGFLIFDLAASAMNLLYTTAVAGAGGISNGHFTLARLTYSIIYVVILYVSCNKCFQLIDWLPEHAIKWMGGQSLHHANMGDPMEVGNYMALAGGYVDQQIVQGAGKLASSPAGGPLLAYAAAKSDGIRNTVHGAMERLGQDIHASPDNIQKATGDFDGISNKIGALGDDLKKGGEHLGNIVSRVTKGQPLDKAVGSEEKGDPVPP